MIMRCFLSVNCLLVIELLRYWVVTTLGEGLASKDAPRCHPTALNQAVLGNCLVAIMGARRVKTACISRQSRRDDALIKSDYG